MHLAAPLPALALPHSLYPSRSSLPPHSLTSFPCAGARERRRRQRRVRRRRRQAEPRREEGAQGHAQARHEADPRHQARDDQEVEELALCHLCPGRVQVGGLGHLCHLWRGQDRGHVGPGRAVGRAGRLQARPLCRGRRRQGRCRRVGPRRRVGPQPEGH